MAGRKKSEEGECSKDYDSCCRFAEQVDIHASSPAAAGRYDPDILSVSAGLPKPGEAAKGIGGSYDNAVFFLFGVQTVRRDVKGSLPQRAHCARCGLISDLRQ